MDTYLSIDEHNIHCVRKTQTSCLKMLKQYISNLSNGEIRIYVLKRHLNYVLF